MKSATHPSSIAVEQTTAGPGCATAAIGHGRQCSIAVGAGGTGLVTSASNSKSKSLRRIAKAQRAAILLIAVGVVSACGGPAIEKSEPVGQLRAAIQATSHHDIAAMGYRIVAAGQTCETTAIAATVVPFETEILPTSVAPQGSGNRHAFADNFFTLPAGNYHVCATPLQASGAPSTECASVTADANVVRGTTTEVLLVSQCRGDDSGGLDVSVALNDPPYIDQLSILPSKFIKPCEIATISAAAGDPNEDVLSYAWKIVSEPQGGKLLGATETVDFVSDVVGDYVLGVTVTDLFQSATSLTFPVHVSGTSCNDGNVCNGVESCGGGICQPGTALSLDDGDACTTDRCDPMKGVTHTQLADGTTCGGTNICLGGLCTSCPHGMSWSPTVQQCVCPTGTVRCGEGCANQTTTFSADISVTCITTGQQCAPAYISPFNVSCATGIVVSYTAPPRHCSDVAVTFAIDDRPIAASQFIGPGESTGTVDLGIVAPGAHTISAVATGRLGGCNPGWLNGWGGSLQATLSVVSP